MNLFNKPKSITIDLAQLKPDDLEYYCSTKEIDKIVIETRGLPWDQSLADAMDKEMKYYFVVTKNREYDSIPGNLFEPWLEKAFGGPIMTVSGEVEGWDKLSNSGKIIEAPQAEISYIEPVTMPLTAKARACRNHFILDVLKKYYVPKDKLKPFKS